MDFWNKLVGGIGNFFGGGQNNQAFGGFNLPNMGQGLMRMFGFGWNQGGDGNQFGGQNSIPKGANYNPYTGSQISGNLNSWGSQGGGNFFGRNPMLSGIGTLFGSQLLGNPKPPKLPQSFYNYQNQALGGGTPGQQQAGQYYQGVLSGNNQGAYDAATHSIDLAREEALRQLNGTYKSLRPGTDYLTDTTYQRDLKNLNDQYDMEKARALAGVQQGAAQGAAGLGSEVAGQQAQAMEAQLQQIASQWGMDYSQREQLRQMLMSLGGNLASYGMFSQLFPNAFNR